MPARRLILILVAAAGLLAGAADARAQDSASAQHFVADLAAESIRVMTGPGLSDEQRRREFRRLFLGSADMPTIDRLVLGRYWRVATPEQRNRFEKLFEELMVYTWSNRFKNTAGSVRLEISGTAPEPGGGIRVESTIVRQNQQPIAVGWRMRAVDGKWRIIDLTVAGTSMITTYRQEYAAVIAENGGSVDALLQALHRKLAQLAQAG